MSVYHWLVVLIILLSFLLRAGRKGRTLFIISVFILMFGIQGLRDCKTIGNDSRTSYLDEFYSMAGKEWVDIPDIRDWAHIASDDESFEGRDRNFATNWLMKIVFDRFNGDYQWFIATVAIIVLFSEAFFIHRFSPSPLQSVLYYLGLLFFVFQMSATKQSLAMSILLFAFSAIIDRKPILFIILVVFASFFHFPALVFLPAYWIANMRLGRNYFILLVAIFIMTYLFRGRLLSMLNDAYYDSEGEAVSTTRFLANKVIVMLLVIVAALVIRPPRSDDRVYCALLQLMGVSAVIQTFAGYDNVFERLADYYYQLSVVFIPMVFENNHRQSNLSPRTMSMIHRYAPFIFCAFAIWRFLDNVINDWHFYPFRFFFQ